MSSNQPRPKFDFTHIPEVLWAQDVADLLGVKVVQARRLMRRGKIPAKRFGKRWYVLRDEFLRCLKPDRRTS